MVALQDVFINDCAHDPCLQVGYILAVTVHGRAQEQCLECVHVGRIRMPNQRLHEDERDARRFLETSTGRESIAKDRVGAQMSARTSNG